LGRTPCLDLNDSNGSLLVKAGDIIEENHLEKIVDLGIRSLKIRSVLTCETENGICSKCYGRDLARGTSVNVGEAVGIIAAQSIGEPGTQLTMRTFHIGGAASSSVEQSNTMAPIDGIVKLDNLKIIEDKFSNKIVLNRNAKIKIEVDNIEKFSTNIPFGSKIFVKDGDQVKSNKVLAEWDPYTLPIIAERNGFIKFIDLKQGISFRESIDDTTGISSKIIIDWSQNPKSKNFKPAINVQESLDGDDIKDDNFSNYPMSIDTILSVEDGQEVYAGQVLARIPKESSKTKDITGGLPRVAELFEARKAKDSAIIAENDGQVIFGKEVRGKQRVSIVPEDGAEPSNYLIPKGKHINFNQGEKIKKGEYLLDGQPLPHDILRILGIKELTEYFVNQVQEVYRLQGVIINDKHIETILRQMLKKVEVKLSGDSSYLPGEIVDRIKFDNVNEKLKSEGKAPATGERVLMGITKASLQTESFISAASFQETTRVLTDAAIKGKIDPLNGLKENVIVGRLVPAGTGNIKNRWNKKALDDDNKFLSEQEKIEPSETPVNQ